MTAKSTLVIIKRALQAHFFRLLARVLVTSLIGIGLGEQAAAASGRILYFGNDICGATLIKNNRIVTAAHCLVNPSTRKSLRIERLKFRPDGTTRLFQILSIKMGREFQISAKQLTRRELARDIAVLEVSSSPHTKPTELSSLPRGPLSRGSGLHVDSGAGNEAGRNCRVVRDYGDLITIDCKLQNGMSGSGVFQRTRHGRRLLAVVSAYFDGKGQTIVTPTHGITVPALSRDNDN